MSTVVLVARDPHVVDQVTFATDGQLTHLTGEDADELTSALTTGPAAGLLMIDAGPDPSGAIAIGDWARQRAGLPVVLITEEPDAIALAAMRAGIRDMISPQATVDEFRDTITQHSRRSTEEGGQQAPRGRLITVASPKGGVGKTTVATNIAVGLAGYLPDRVVLVDLDLHFGDVASALNLNPAYTLPDTIRPAASSDPLALKPYLTRHETALWVVAGADNPAAADSVTADEVATLITSLRQSFDFVVVDTSPGLSEHTLAALDLTDELVLVTGLDVPGVRGLRKEIETLTELSLLLEPRHVVINFADASRGLTVADVEATINTKVDVTLPSSKVVPISVNQGIPLLQTGGKDPLTRSLSSLVERIAKQPRDHQQPKGKLFARGRAAANGTR